MATATEVPMATNGVAPVVDTMATSGGVSDIFKVTHRFGGFLENTQVNIEKLYLRQIMAGSGANQYVVTKPNEEGLGRPTGVSNWAIYDSAGSQANLVANGQGMYTFAGNWNNWFTLLFRVDERFKGSTLQVMGVSADNNEENEWAIVGGTGKFAMARGIIKRRVVSVIRDTITQELTIEFFCRMKGVVPPPMKRGPWGGNGGSLNEMQGKSQRLESVTISHGGVVAGIGFTYIDEDGRIHTAGVWGQIANGGSLDRTETIPFGPSELVKQITGAVSTRSDVKGYLTQFYIVTNKKKYGPFGAWDGNAPFSYNVAEGETVVGFFANAQSLVYNVGLYTI